MKYIRRNKDKFLCESFPYFEILLILFSIFLCLPTLPPFVNLSVDTLAKAKRLTHFYSVAPLLEKRFACFPTSGDGLHSLLFLLCTHLTSERHGKTKTPLPSFLSGGQNLNDDIIFNTVYEKERWQANCIFRSGATRKCNETPYPTNGSGKNPA